MATLKSIQCIEKDDIKGLEAALLTGECLVNDTDESGMTALQHAAYKGNLRACQLLLKQVRSEL